MPFRTLNTDLKNSLLTGEEFVYAHLIKFEHGKLGTSSEGSQRATDYAYITDGSHDIEFDDGSVDSAGNANGIQTYIANRVKKVGDVTQKIAPTAATVSLQLSSLALNTNITQDITIGAAVSGSSTTIDGISKFGKTTIVGVNDLVQLGFAEGDKVRLLMSNGSDSGNNTAGNNNGLYFRIDSFTNENKTINVTAIDKTLTAVTTATLATLDFASEEAIGPLRNRSITGYASYLNRSVLIYKAHINPATGKVIGMVENTKKEGPYLLYKGIIATAKLSEDATKESRISWGLVSHWGDFQRVNNRITSDSEHRKTDAAGMSDLDSLVRPEYAKDLGFQHSEQAVNLLTQYTTIEQEARTGKKKKWYGKKVYIYYVDVEKTNDVDIKFNLQAKALPVIYGVNKTKGLPVFVDTDKTDASLLYIAYALCEGQIAGLYDIHFDDSSSICVDKIDSDSRSTQTDNQNIDVLCMGRQDKGETLGFDTVESTTKSLFSLPGRSYGTQSWSTEGWTQQDVSARSMEGFEPTTAWTQKTKTTSAVSSTGQGVKAGKGTIFKTPIDSQFVFYDGSANQKASTSFINIAKNNNFKIQSDYFDTTTDYWGPNHQLLDTAYLTAEYTISEGETTIPSQHFTVRGKLVDCYNYDFMYRRDIRSASGVSAFAHVNPSNFNIGDEVNLYNSEGNALISGGPYTIAEVRTVYDPSPILDEAGILKVRLTSKPALGDVGAFYIKNSNNDKIFLQTHNGVIRSGTVGAELKTTVTSVADGTARGIQVTANTSALTGLAEDFRNVFSVSFNPFSINFTAGQLAALARLISAIKSNTYTFDTISAAGSNLSDGVLDNIGEGTEDKADLVGTDIIIKDGVRLDSNASSVTDYYKGAKIELKTILDGQVRLYDRWIKNYNGTTKTAYLDEELPFQAQTSWTFKIYTTPDERVSINPAMQCLDYLQSDRFGPEMKLNDDLDLESFISAARDCDERSNVIVSFYSNVPESVFGIGDIFRYPSTGTAQFIGTVKSKQTFTSLYKGTNAARVQVEFTDVLGKLGTKWNNWRTFKQGDLIWYQSKFSGAAGDAESSTSVVFTANGNGTTNIVESSPSSGNVNLSLTNLTVVNSVSLRKVGTSNDYSISLIPNFEGNPLVKSFDLGSASYAKSGYTLYDSDGVKYWRYVGWDAHEQSYATRHQLSPIIDTSRTLLENTNDFLQHFNGMLRYNAGKYELAIQKASVATDYETVSVGSDTYTPHIITEDDIIGPINVDDAGQKGMFNTMSSTLSDPLTLFNERQVTFFNSDYLKQDKYVPKKGTASTPFITNYYNARMFAKLNLDLSRFSIGINFTMGPKGTLLLPGQTIKVNHARFGWENKEYRITSIVLTSDCLVRITAEEHDNNSFSNVNSLTVGSVSTGEQSSFSPIKSPDAPSSIQIGAAKRGGVFLSWTNVDRFNPSTFTVQIWRNSNISFTGGSGATLVGTSKGTNFTDQVTNEGRTTNYYWLRYEVLVPARRSKQTAPRELFSNYNPVKTADGLEGISDGALDGSVINFSNSNSTIPTDSSDALVFSNTGTSISVNIGATAVPYDDSSPFASPSFRVTGVAASGVTLADPAVSSTSGNNYVTHNIAGMSGATGTITYTIVVKDTIDREVTYTRVQTFSKSLRGSTGATGVNSRTVVLRSDQMAFTYDENGANPSPATTTLRASSLNTSGTAKYQFVKIAANGAATVLQAINTQATYTYTPPASFANTPETIEVRLFEGADATTQYAADSIAVGAIKESSSALSAIMSNEAHAVPASFAGVVSSMADSGTTIAVFEGATALAFITSGTVAAGQFEVSASATNITTIGAITDSGTFATIGNHSGFSSSSDTAKVVYTISGKRADGTAFSFTRQQTFSKSSDAQSIITVELSNPIAQLPTLISSGSTYAAPDFTTSPTDIRVKEGETELTFITTGTTAAGQYKIVTTTNPSSGLTVGTPLSRIQSGSIHFARTPEHSAMNVDSIDVIYTITGRRADGEVFVRAPAQSLTKNKIGATGGPGVTSPRVRSGYIYYQSASATNPVGSSAVSNTDVVYNFTTDTLSGGVIGTTSTKWNQIQSAYTGNNTNKYWYARYTVTEASFGGSYSVTFTVAYEGQNFTGLVTFTSNQISDGTNSISTSGSGNTTTIDGGSITADTITSQQIKLSGTGSLVISAINNDSGYQVNTSTRTGGSVGGWTLTSTELTGGAGVAIKSGLTDYSPTDGTASGFYLGNENNSFTGSVDKPVFMVGKEQGQRLTWNGSTLEIEGTLKVGTLGSGWGINEHGIYAPADESSAEPSSGGNNNTKYTSLVSNKNVIQLLYDATTGGSIHSNNFYIAKDGTAGLGGWTIDSDGIFTGTKDTSGFTSTGGHITLASAGSLHSKNFYIDTSGNAFFKGSVQGGDISTTTAAIPTGTNTGYGLYPDGSMFVGDRNRHILVSSSGELNVVGLTSDDIIGAQIGIVEIIEFDAYKDARFYPYWVAQSGSSNYFMKIPTASYTYSNQSVAGKRAYSRIFGSTSPDSTLRAAWDEKHLGSTSSSGTGNNYLIMGTIPAKSFTYRPYLQFQGNIQVYDHAEIRFQVQHNIDTGASVINSFDIDGSQFDTTWGGYIMTIASSATNYSTFNTNQSSYIGQEVTVVSNSQTLTLQISAVYVFGSVAYVYFSTPVAWFSADASATMTLPTIAATTTVFTNVGKEVRITSDHGNRSTDLATFSAFFEDYVPAGADVDIRVLVRKYYLDSNNNHSRRADELTSGQNWDWNGNIEGTLTGDDTDVISEFTMTAFIGRGV